MERSIQCLKEGLSCSCPRVPGENEPGGIVVDRILQSADAVNEGEAAVTHADELADSARLEIGWHEKQIASRIDASCEGSFERADEDGIGVEVHDVAEYAFPLSCRQDEQREVAMKNMLKQWLAMVFLHQHLDLLVGGACDHDDERARYPF